MLDIFKAVILGIVEGITEFLPISSTGHLVLVDEFIKMQQSTQFTDMFNVVIQLGAIMAGGTVSVKNVTSNCADNGPHGSDNHDCLF
ncbi:hypothetical protein WP50_04470 [Lactiplantibacillus plantarum]|nr:hypothetical protein WP50_04470 [Lactiplantibacillus plantarum]